MYICIGMVSGHSLYNLLFHKQINRFMRAQNASTIRSAANAVPVLAGRFSHAVGDTLDGRYTLEAKIGEGAYGAVYRVLDTLHGEVRAMKILKLWEVPESDRRHLNRRFDREYETGQIASPYLVQSVGKGVVQGNPYIVMEYCPGGNLQEVCHDGCGRLPALAGDVLMGLHSLHTHGKVHRDLKPSNVLLRADGQAALTDFGIVGDQQNRMTQRGLGGIPIEKFGTWAYMPPEQVNPRRGNATVLPTTDLFSFGVMVYEMLTGRLPFGPLASVEDLAGYIAHGRENRWDREALLALPGGDQWMPIVEGCLQADFGHRTQSAADALALLTAAGRRSIPAAAAIAEGRQRLLLRVMQGEEPGRTYRLDDLAQRGHDSLAMGRATEETDNDIGIRETESCFISRRHCTLERDPNSGRWTVHDGQWMADVQYWKASLNGTFLNAHEVDGEGMALTPGDILTLGDVTLRVETY